VSDRPLSHRPPGDGAAARAASLIAVAVRERSPVIIQTSVKTVRSIGLDLLFAMWREMTAGIEVPVSLHLDHCPDRAVISACLRKGWNSVLFDASSLPVAENQRQTIEAVVSDLPFNGGDDVALMLNGLGGTPISELYLLYGRAHSELVKRGINVRRSYVGEYCTSVDMAGASLTLSRLDGEIDDLLGTPAEIAIRTF
jgi:hypothetical protein